MKRFTNLIEGAGRRPRTPADLWGRLRRRIHRWRLRPGELDPGRWWNGSLRSRTQVETTVLRARSARLPMRCDPESCWDSLESLELILAVAGAGERIADIGLHPFEPLVSWLALVGYEGLRMDARVRVGANRALTVMAGGGAEADVVEEAGRDPHAVVICRKSAEDRIPLGRRLVQASRLLEPGGVFVLSAEFWDMPEPFQGGARNCSAEHVCCRSRATELMDEAESLGLAPLAPLFVGRPPVVGSRQLPGVGVSPFKIAFRKIT